MVVSSLVFVVPAFVRRTVPTLVVATLGKGMGEGHADQQAERRQS